MTVPPGREVSGRVVNVKGRPRAEYDVFIGRPSKWGNPFKIGRDGAREEVVAKYREWITRHPTLDPRELRGQVLGCFCAPLACHGDVLAELADSGERIEGAPSN